MFVGVCDRRQRALLLIAGCCVLRRLGVVAVVCFAFMSYAKSQSKAFRNTPQRSCIHNIVARTDFRRAAK